MRKIEQKINLYGKICKAEMMEFGEEDKEQWKKLWNTWMDLKLGLRSYEVREPNLSEGLSEIAFCIYTGSKRLLNVTGGCNASADSYHIERMEAEQIKATSIGKDLTSFGPKTKWDKLYFLDFYRNGELDGSFDCYEIDKELIYSTVVNKGKNETFRDQQNQGRRPRLSLKKIIQDNNIQPCGVDIKVWL